MNKKNPITLHERFVIDKIESVNAQVVAAAKHPVLNLNEFYLWKMRIEQYFLMTDYALWKVILNGDSPPPTRTIEGVKQFNIHKDAKSLMEAIEKRCGGNKETKKVQKTLLKQQYENFNGSSLEELDQIHDRLQKLISQLEIHGESISQEDVNLKFLRSLPSEWKTHTLIWRNKTNLEELSLDDLFNNLKIYEAKSSKRVTEEELDQESSKRDDLVMLWSLVKEKFNLTEPTDNKEREIWVELKRLFELEKGIDIYMLVEKEYPLSRGTLTLMLVAKLLVD
ncbi:hypothetical protein Tco_0098050 [Tanacetum coccineum]